ncbi:MAG TPA: sodium:solute symporter family protein, partial [Prolixibacteraceae bacterium]|nr:sodium:solute symporter family protein [Prolixibacteraceae bacterium]
GSKINIKYPQLITFLIGAVAMLLATHMQNVLELMLYSYAFMVSGLLFPVVGFLVYKKPSAKAAMYSMISGGTITLLLIIFNPNLPFGLDPNFFGIGASALVFIALQTIFKR